MKERAVRILVVDDEDVVRSVMRDALDRPGWYVVLSEDGEKAISLLLDEHFDVLVADKNLPGITGLDVIRRAKAINKSMGTLLVTAYASRDSAEEALSLGVDEYMTKPFDVDEFLGKVKDVIELRSRLKDVKLRSAESSGSAEKKKVLVFEPSVDSRKSIVNGIKKLGCEAFWVENLGEVLVEVRKKSLDALVCDLDALDRDDATACFLRSALIVSPEVRFVAVAAKKSMDGAIQAVNRGAGRVIYKSLLSEKYIIDSLGEFLAN